MSIITSVETVLPMITMEELEQHGMPLHTAMDKLREKAMQYMIH